MGRVDLRRTRAPAPTCGVVAGSGRPAGPGGVVLGADQLGLEPVDPAHEAAEQRVGAAAEVVVLQRQLVDPLDQHGQPVTGAERRPTAASAPRGPARIRLASSTGVTHEQLLVAALQPALQAGPQGVGAGRRTG